MILRRKKILVSVIIASLNREHFIRDAIESVLNQSYDNIEIIIVDGGSTDGTVEILKDYGSKIRWIFGDDDGEADANNKGLKVCKGEIVNFLPSDDFLEPDAIKNAVEAFSNANSDVVMINGDGLMIDKIGNVIYIKKSVQFSEKKLIKICPDKIIQPSTFIKKKAIENVCFWDKNIQYASDLDLWIRIHKKYRSKYIPIPLSYNRVHQGSLTVSRFSSVVFDSLKVRKKYGGLLSLATLRELRFLLRHVALKYLLIPGTKRYNVVRKSYHYTTRRLYSLKL